MSRKAFAVDYKNSERGCWATEVGVPPLGKVIFAIRFRLSNYNEDKLDHLYAAIASPGNIGYGHIFLYRTNNVRLVKDES